jgi:hypothetical protein
MTIEFANINPMNDIVISVETKGETLEWMGGRTD